MRDKLVITVPIEEEAIDEATKQALLTIIRETIHENFDKIVEPLVKDLVIREINQYMSETGWRGKTNEEIIHEAVKEWMRKEGIANEVARIAKRHFEAYQKTAQEQIENVNGLVKKNFTEILMPMIKETLSNMLK